MGSVNAAPRRVVQDPSAGHERPPLPICVIIVSYNRSRDLHRCLASLQRLTPAVSRVMVVDNGSTDGTLEMVREDYPWVELYRATYNLGPCIARNAAVLASDEPILWFLDSDTEVVGADGAAQLLALLDDPTVGAVGGEAVLGDAEQVVGVKHLRLSVNAFVQGDILLSEKPVTAPCEVMASCNLMLRRDDFLALDGFDPFYFFFYEDTDLTWRLHRRGLRLVALSPMPVVHRYSESVRIRRVWLRARNRAYFCLKNQSWSWNLQLPFRDMSYFLRMDSFFRLLRQVRKPSEAISLVTLNDPSKRQSIPLMLSRGIQLLADVVAKTLLTYPALAVVLGRALAARRAGGKTVVMSATAENLITRVTGGTPRADAPEAVDNVDDELEQRYAAAS